MEPILFVLIHLKSDGSVMWSTTSDPNIPEDLIKPGEMGVVIHPMMIVAHQLGGEEATDNG